MNGLKQLLWGSFMKIFNAALLVVSGLLLSGCTQLTLAWADLSSKGDKANPHVLGAMGGQGEIASADAWQDLRAPLLRELFQDHLYGAFPDSMRTQILSQRIVDTAAFDGAGTLSEIELRGAARYGEHDTFTKGSFGGDGFYMSVVTPNNVEGPVPVVLMQTFSSRARTLPHEGVTGASQSQSVGGPLMGLIKFVFGRYIETPPVEDILARGYAVAAIHPPEYVPDHKEAGVAALDALTKHHDDPKTRMGAIAAWAWGYSMMIDALEQEGDKFSKYVSWGHSRYGKAALLAAAYDARIDAVISHQSGTGGASLNRRKKGESVQAITDSYPHWFAPIYGEYAGRETDMPVDQHQLLALIAPRPILLGNARRDVWSDPNGAFRAAIGADPVYELYGKQGLSQSRMNEWVPSAELAVWIRPGTHGIVKEDWPAFLEFLDAHVK